MSPALKWFTFKLTFKNWSSKALVIKRLRVVINFCNALIAIVVLVFILNFLLVRVDFLDVKFVHCFTRNF